MKNLVVVLPTIDEAGSIEGLLRSVLAWDRPIRKYSLKIVVVDGGSKDRTCEIVQRVAKETDRVFLLKQKAAGLGAAIMEGMEMAVGELRADAVVTMDADGSHRSSQLSSLVAKLSEADVVIGSRYSSGGAVHDWSLVRKVVSKWGNKYLRLMLGLVKVNDFTSNFRAYSRSAVMALINHGNLEKDWTWLSSSLFSLSMEGMRIREVPIVFSDRVLGESKMRMRRYMWALVSLGIRCRLVRVKQMLGRWDGQLVYHLSRRWLAQDKSV